MNTKWPSIAAVVIALIAAQIFYPGAMAPVFDVAKNAFVGTAIVAFFIAFLLFA